MRITETKIEAFRVTQEEGTFCTKLKNIFMIIRCDKKNTIEKRKGIKRWTKILLMSYHLKHIG